jgi:hypothetical protein
VEERRAARAVVQERALVQRINKIWDPSDKRLVKCRAAAVREGLGNWAVIDAETREVISYHHDLVQLGGTPTFMQPNIKWPVRNVRHLSAKETGQ